MKLHLATLVIFLVTYGNFAKDVTIKHIRYQWKENILHVLDECTTQSHVNPRVVEAFFENGHMPNNPAWKCFLKCEGMALEVLSPTGAVDVQKAADTYAYIDVPLAQKCADESKETDLCEKAFELVKCVHDDLGKKHPEEISI